jgi:hypothetical protein
MLMFGSGCSNKYQDISSGITQNPLVTEFTEAINNAPVPHSYSFSQIYDFANSGHWNGYELNGTAIDEKLVNASETKYSGGSGGGGTTYHNSSCSGISSCENFDMEILLYSDLIFISKNTNKSSIMKIPFDEYSCYDIGPMSLPRCIDKTGNHITYDCPEGYCTNNPGKCYGISAQDNIFCFKGGTIVFYTTLSTYGGSVTKWTRDHESIDVKNLGIAIDKEYSAEHPLNAAG